MRPLLETAAPSEPVVGMAYLPHAVVLAKLSAQPRHNDKHETPNASGALKLSNSRLAGFVKLTCSLPVRDKRKQFAPNGMNALMISNEIRLSKHLQPVKRINFKSMLFLIDRGVKRSRFLPRPRARA